MDGAEMASFVYLKAKVNKNSYNPYIIYKYIGLKNTSNRRQQKVLNFFVLISLAKFLLLR
jgi:hypothetical protein